MADQPKCVYTAVTFAPVQGFIEKFLNILYVF